MSLALFQLVDLPEQGHWHPSRKREVVGMGALVCNEHDISFDLLCMGRGACRHSIDSLDLPNPHVGSIPLGVTQPVIEARYGERRLAQVRHSHGKREQLAILGPASFRTDVRL